MKSIIFMSLAIISFSTFISIKASDTEVNQEVVEQFRQAEVNWFTKSTDKDLQKSKQGDASTTNQSFLGKILATIIEQFLDILYNSVDIFHIWKSISYLLCCCPCLVNVPYQRLHDLMSRISQQLGLVDLMVMIQNKLTARRVDV